jgi:hypothetical protein
MTDRITPFPGKRPETPADDKPNPGGPGRVLQFDQGEAAPAPSPSLHDTDVLVAGANPLLNALAALAEIRAGRRVIVVPFEGADDWDYDLGVQATFHRFVDAAAETLYALSPSRRLDFRNTPFPDAHWGRLFQRLQERRRRILDADVLRLEPGVGILWQGESSEGLRLVLGRPPTAAPLGSRAELACIRSACSDTWESDIPRAVFASAPGQEQAIQAAVLVLTSDVVPDLPSTSLRIKRLGSARGAYADAAQKSDRAFDDVLEAIRAVAHPEI